MLNAVKLDRARGGGEGEGAAELSEVDVVYRLRDYEPEMVEAWKDSFAQHSNNIEISLGDIFKHAPSADAIVSPANSFGFMDGGIDMVYSLHFGWELQKRLQEDIRTKKNGELLVGDALILPIYEDAAAEQEARDKVSNVKEWSIFNEGQPIKYLISAPTMRVPMDVMDTVNAYLAFRAVILAVKEHNADPSKEAIRTVLCPGLGTAVGRMPKPVCANQMLLAYETFQLGMHRQRVHPKTLHEIFMDDSDMKQASANLTEDQYSCE